MPVIQPWNSITVREYEELSRPSLLHGKFENLYNMWTSSRSMMISYVFDLRSVDKQVQKPCVTTASKIWKRVLTGCIFLSQSLQKFWKRSQCNVGRKSCQGRYDSRKHQVSKYMIARKYMNKVWCFRLFAKSQNREWDKEQNTLMAAGSRYSMISN